MNPLCANRALAIAPPSRRTTESTLSSNSLRAARASGSMDRITTISGSVLASMAACPPSYNCLRTATSSSFVLVIISFAASAAVFPFSTFCTSGLSLPRALLHLTERVGK